MRWRDKEITVPSFFVYYTWCNNLRLYNRMILAIIKMLMWTKQQTIVHFLGLQNSYGIIFHSTLFEKFLWATFAFISVKLYTTLLKIFRTCIYKNFVIAHFTSPHLKLAFLEFKIFSILKLKLLHWTTIIFIFWDFLMFYQISLSPQVKRCAIITYKHCVYELLHELPNDLRLIRKY